MRSGADLEEKYGQDDKVGPWVKPNNNQIIKKRSRKFLRAESIVEENRK